MFFFGTGWWMMVFGIGFFIPITAIVMDSMKKMYVTRANTQVQMLRHQENIERLRGGYPPIDDKGREVKALKSAEVIDMTAHEPDYSPETRRGN
ncbi:MAG: hypothetical protein FWE91_02210 [Defluviitaleaceae bacterium]|nr:hypothetical protein [Defluviitaleaceae bacterium]MCL2835120.1 hypothetical protein [Defluviitaleaceae bacterium]